MASEELDMKRPGPQVLQDVAPRYDVVPLGHLFGGLGNRGV